MRGVEEIPALYDAMMAFAEASGFREWREQLVAGADGLVLDVGCGTGRNLPLYGASPQVVGLDPRLQLLEAARRRSPRTALVAGSAEALPFRDGTFDVVVSGLVFCSVPDPVADARARTLVAFPDGAMAGPHPAGVDVGGRRVSPEPRHRGQRRGSRIRHRG
jgi:SAM-dependent methyltransferase